MVRERRNGFTARTREEGIHALNKINIVVSMKILIEYIKRSSIVAVRKRLKTVSQRRGIDKTKRFLFHLT